VLDSPKRVTLAIDTDAEFYARFRSSRAAADYVALLVGCEWHLGRPCSTGGTPCAALLAGARGRRLLVPTFLALLQLSASLQKHISRWSARVT